MVEVLPKGKNDVVACLQAVTDLRWLKIVYCRFYHLNFDGSILGLSFSWRKNYGIKQTAIIIGEQVVIIFLSLQVAISTV